MANKYNENQKTIIAYLKEQVKGGKKFFKAKVIGKDIDLSPKVVGTNMMLLSKKHKTIKITPWSTTSAITWRVEYPIRRTTE
jgi:hypothetical protein